MCPTQIAGLTGETTGDSDPPIVREVNRFITIISTIAITIGVVFLGVGIGMGVMTVVQVRGRGCGGRGGGTGIQSQLRPT